MKNGLHIRYLFFFFAFSIFASCKKDKAETPVTPQTPTLYNTVLGKWNVTIPSGKVQQSNISSKIQSPVELTSIEFLSDTTYVVVMNETEVSSGTFKVTDSTSITLPNFGSLSEIKVADGKMNFKLSYNGSTLVLTANKAAEVALTGDTKLLCRTWLLANTDSMYESYENGVNRITVLFSSAGTYLVQVFRNDTLVEANIANWEWHPTKSKTILYWWDDEEPSDDDFVTITELTSTSLKMHEIFVDGNDTEEYNYVLTPYVHSGRVSQSSMKQIITSRHGSGHGLFGLHK